MIDRAAVVRRHTVRYTQSQPGAPLTVGNGEFAFTADVTGLQTFAAEHERPVGRSRGTAVMPLGTQAQWAYHWAPNVDGWTLADTMETLSGPRGPVQYPTRYDFSENQLESEAAGRAAGYYFWVNPQRMHLGRVGFVLLERPDGPRAAMADLHAVEQELDLWTGTLHSRFGFAGSHVDVVTAVHPGRDALAVQVRSPLLATGNVRLEVAFPYVDATFEADPDWSSIDRHDTALVPTATGVRWERQVDASRYVAEAGGIDSSQVRATAPHTYVIDAGGSDEFSMVMEFAPSAAGAPLISAAEVVAAAADHWSTYWGGGAAVDLSQSTDPRAQELTFRTFRAGYLVDYACWV